MQQTTEKQIQKYFPDKMKRERKKGETTKSYKFLAVEENSVSSGNSF